MASWDIDTYLKQTVSPNPASLFEMVDLEKGQDKKMSVIEPKSEEFD